MSQRHELIRLHDAAVSARAGWSHAIRDKDGRPHEAAARFTKAESAFLSFVTSLFASPTEGEVEHHYDQNADRSYTAAELATLLQWRDDFIVNEGLWGKFVAAISALRPPSGGDTT